MTKRLPLATHTEIRRALTERDRADRRSANLARLAFAPVHEQFLLEIAGLAVGIDEIAQRRAAARDRIFKNTFHFTGELRVALARYRSRRALWMDAGGEQ